MRPGNSPLISRSWFDSFPAIDNLSLRVFPRTRCEIAITELPSDRPGAFSLCGHGRRFPWELVQTPASNRQGNGHGRLRAICVHQTAHQQQPGRRRKFQGTISGLPGNPASINAQGLGRQPGGHGKRDGKVWCFLAHTLDMAPAKTPWFPWPDCGVLHHPAPPGTTPRNGQICDMAGPDPRMALGAEAHLNTVDCAPWMALGQSITLR